MKTALEADSCLPSPSWRKTKRRYAAGLGRNCLIFDSARLWAYREVRNHFGSPESLERAVTAHVHGLNADFKDPLPEQEAQQIANSIVRWVVAESRLWNDGEAVYEATFTAIQFARGRKGGIKSGNVGATKARERNWLL
ncbi:primase C-terminal domain-containing protein [Rothia sp. P5766]|uniref:primase C-terminal domain-containing protein n=1 Tax=Rothia sp. P5766 TaxID=3402656 RepID=UPI003ADFC722